MLRFYLCVFFLLIYLKAISQDIRVSQVNSIPLLINPAKTGDFAGGDFRVNALYANIFNDTINNSFKNISFDKKIGKKHNWALGFNYLNSGSPDFPMSGNYWGISIAKAFFLDKSKTHQIRTGFQTSYLQGEYDSQKGSYNRLFDASVIKYHDEYNNSRSANSLSYWNYSAGVIYSIVSSKIYFESGISAYNITNPRQWDLIPQSGFRKRFRMSIHTSLQYAVSPNSMLRFDHHSWKEGLYLRVFRPVLDEGTEINENTYGITYFNLNPKKNYSIGLFSREWKAAFSTISYNISPKISLAISYEIPLKKIYYDVSHFEASLKFLPKNNISKKIVKPIPFVDNTSEKAGYNILYQNINYYKLNYSTNNNKNLSLTDLDKDGVLDYADKCPDVFGSLYNAGCPLNDTVVNVHKPILVSASLSSDNIQSIYFDYNDFKLNANGIVIADRLVALLKANNQYSVNLLGLASIEGKFDYNMKLSRKRVVTLAGYLQSFGVHENRIFTAYAGSKYAKVKSNNIYNRWLDRKVVIDISNDNLKHIYDTSK
jgi:outer membrane protein OmpA-like peptidoglycan-associated protein